MESITDHLYHDCCNTMIDEHMQDQYFCADSANEVFKYLK